MIDKIEKITMIVFKFGILLIGVVFLVVYYWSSQNGRFQKFSTDEIDIFILDTRTGIFYEDDGTAQESVNILNGEKHLYKYTTKK